LSPGPQPQGDAQLFLPGFIEPIDLRENFLNCRCHVSEL
jgi:hypothetical protein